MDFEVVAVIAKGIYSPLQEGFIFLPRVHLGFHLLGISKMQENSSAKNRDNHSIASFASAWSKSSKSK